MQDAVAEPPGMGGQKFRKKRENNAPKGLKDKMFRKPLSNYISGQSESTEKVSLHHSFCSSLPPHLLLIKTGYRARWSSAVSGQAVL